MKITDDVDVALEEITTFYRNYHSLRFVDGDLVLRMHTLPTDAELAALNEEFADIVIEGRDRAVRAEQGRARRQRRPRPRPAALPLRPPRIRALAAPDRPPEHTRLQQLVR